jgi:hypothetical protein
LHTLHVVVTVWASDALCDVLEALGPSATSLRLVCLKLWVVPSAKGPDVVLQPLTSVAQRDILCGGVEEINGLPEFANRG